MYSNFSEHSQVANALQSGFNAGYQMASAAALREHPNTELSTVQYEQDHNSIEIHKIKPV